jgi:hypothetical protein
VPTLTSDGRRAPRARLEHATYCLGDRRLARPELARCRSGPMWRARERPWLTADHCPIGHATGTAPLRARACRAHGFRLVGAGGGKPAAVGEGAPTGLLVCGLAQALQEGGAGGNGVPSVALLG